jgi:hypothetical protein
MTDALETLARELDVWGKELFGAHSAGAKTLSAAAAACRELADVRAYFGSAPGDQEERWNLLGRIDGQREPATDAALAAFMEGR